MLGAVLPRTRCCSTDAGSVSPWTTISRIRSARCSPGHLLPGRLALVLAEADRPVGVLLGEEDAPAVLLHRHVVEVRPAVAADRDRRAQVDVLGRQRRAERLPPVEELRLPALERPLQPPVVGEVDVVGDPLGVVDLAERPGRAWGLRRCGRRCWSSRLLSVRLPLSSTLPLRTCQEFVEFRSVLVTRRRRGRAAAPGCPVRRSAADGQDRPEAAQLLTAAGPSGAAVHELRHGYAVAGRLPGVVAVQDQEAPVEGRGAQHDVPGEAAVVGHDGAGQGAPPAGDEAEQLLGGRRTASAC